MTTARQRPTVFIGSSSEGHKIARAIQVLLDRACEVEIWDQGVFGLSQGTLESLVLALGRFDFAILVLTADDLTIKRGESRPAARDNVLFELGLFTGGLGRNRTFMVFDRSDPPELPTDLAGVTPATFEPHASGNLNAALGAACTQIETQIERLGVRDQERFKGLAEAADNVKGVGSQMQHLIRLLARSRKVELDIISSQFGPVIVPDKLNQLRDDLQDLQNVLDAHEASESADRKRRLRGILENFRINFLTNLIDSGIIESKSELTYERIFELSQDAHVTSLLSEHELFGIRDELEEFAELYTSDG
ncbi:MAG: nucleotide-binding protein [bacterium]|nr:nucleotide-binding protein [bacterium]